MAYKIVADFYNNWYLINNVRGVLFINNELQMLNIISRKRRGSER